MSFQSEMTKKNGEKFNKLGVTILSDATDELESWFTRQEIGAVLLRPDRYILGIAETQSDLSDLIAFFENK